MEILGASLRICVDDLDTAIPFYERLAGGTALRFERGGVQVAAIDVEEAHRLLTELGARIIAGPVPTPVGRNLIAMHPDGSVFEYVDHRG